MGTTLVIGLVHGGIYGLLAIGIVLVYKGTRVINFAQGEMGGLSLYIAWLLIEGQNWPWAAGALVAIVSMGVLGFAFERIVVRHMGDAPRLSVTVATIGLLLLILGVELKIWEASPQILRAPIEGTAVEVFGFFVSAAQMMALLTIVGVAVALTAFFRRTDFGLGVLAASQDPTATRLMGVPLKKVSSFTWVAAGVLGSMAALLIAPTIGSFYPGLMTNLFVWGLAAALVGGLTNLSGAFLGGVVVGLVRAFVQDAFVESTFPGAETVAVMLLIIGMLVLRPQGLLGKAAA